jgi:hypothetical protein
VFALPFFSMVPFSLYTSCRTITPQRVLWLLTRGLPVLPTGKTTVAGIYGRILYDLGLLTKGDVLVKNPSDFLGTVLGESEQKTVAILEEARGCVLVIDEAYGLHSKDSKDPYKVDRRSGNLQLHISDQTCADKEHALQTLTAKTILAIAGGFAARSPFPHVHVASIPTSSDQARIHYHRSLKPTHACFTLALKCCL